MNFIPNLREIGLENNKTAGGAKMGRVRNPQILKRFHEIDPTKILP